MKFLTAILRHKEIDRGRHTFLNYVEWKCSRDHVTCFLSLIYYLPTIKFMLRLNVPKPKINIPVE